MRRMQARRWSRVKDGLKKVFAIAMITQQLTPPLTAQAALNNTGRWVATPSLGFSATHVVLLREPVTNRAKLFMFGESGSNQTMKFWTFTPDDATLVTPLTANPLISRLDTIPHPNSRRADLFCSGHATLPDGRMVLIGGGWIPTAMCEDSYTLDPAWTLGNPSPWTRNAEMSVQRWYATATSLPDGRVLASAGTSVSSMMGYGGTVPGAVQVDTCSRTLRPLELSARFTWGDTLIAPACGFGCTPPSHLAALAPPDDYTNSRFPPGRDYHMFAGPGYGQAIMYGGRRSSSTDLLDDVWLVAGSKLPDDSTHGCYLLEQVGDPSVVENGGMPVPRWGFGFTWAGTEINSKGMTPEFSADIPGNNICYIHGGKDANGNVLGDLWRGYMAGAGLHFKWVWKRILAHDASRARFGHVMMFDPGVPNVSDAPRAKLLIYGGLNASGTLADSSAVSAIGVGASSYQAGVWRTIPIDATQVPSPRARIWHSMTPRYKGPNDTEREYYLFGGEDVAGTLVDAQVRVLVRRDLLPPSGGLQRDDEAYKWELQSPAGPGPSARSRASLGYAVDGGTLVVFGGDTNGTQASGGLSNELFRLQAGYSNGSWEWSSPQGRAFHPAPPPTAGMPFVALGEGRAHITRNLEAFTASGQSNLPQCNTSGFGSWQSVSLPSAESERPIADYPNLHVLPDGRLFNAGPAPGGGISLRTATVVSSISRPRRGVMPPFQECRTTRSSAPRSCIARASSSARAPRGLPGTP